MISPSLDEPPVPQCGFKRFTELLQIFFWPFKNRAQLPRLFHHVLSFLDEDEAVGQKVKDLSSGSSLSFERKNSGLVLYTKSPNDWNVFFFLLGHGHGISTCNDLGRTSKVRLDRCCYYFTVYVQLSHVEIFKG